MSDYFFQQPDEEEKREYLRMEAERMRQQMPTQPPSGMSPELSPNGPIPIDGLYSSDLEGQQALTKEEELQKLIEMIITGQR